MKALISDIHANYAALQAVVEDAFEQGCNQFICLGDVAGYHAEINECLALLRSLPGLRLIRGNHDAYLLSGSGCPRSEIVSHVLRFQASIVTSDNLDWLSTSLSHFSCGPDLFVHGGPDDVLEQYVYRVSSELFQDDVDRLFCGHTHVQVLHRIGGRLFCNPGSVGQPRDGNPQAAYAILDRDEVVLRRVEYDVSATEKSMKAAGFPDHYFLNLRKGAQIGGRIDRIHFESL